MYTMNRVDRMLAILLMLQRKHHVRAQDLAQAFRVSERTIYRDMDALSETGVPVLGTPGDGYMLRQGYYLPPLLLTPAEAAIIYAGLKLVTTHSGVKVASMAEDALMKLTPILSNDVRSSAEHMLEDIGSWQLEWNENASTPGTIPLGNAVRDESAAPLEHAA
jgi:predicted DNA-binding transcriptional regulator YafY